MRLRTFVSVLLVAATFDGVDAEEYEFRGHLAPTNRTSTSLATYRSPSDLMGQPFTIRISWPESSDDYSADRQSGADYWGACLSTSISVDIDVADFDFSIPNIGAGWESWNDTNLLYVQGVSQYWGDELRLDTRVNITRQYMDTSGPRDQPHFEPIDVIQRYELLLHAVDYTGTKLHDESLQTDFNLSSFDDVWFEFKEIVPVASSDLRPIHFEHWVGVVDSIIAVPEPSACYVASFGALFLAVVARRHR